MSPKKDLVAVPLRQRLARATLHTCLAAATLAATAYSAILAKEARRIPALAAVEHVETTAGVAGRADPAGTGVPSGERALPGTLLINTPPAFNLSDVSFADAAVGLPVPPALAAAPTIDPLATDPNVRWFDGRPIRPVQKIWMTVTGYSPDAKSCGESADGLTATLHSVNTNAARLVAADPTVLPYGSMLTVPGYDSNLVVPVLDCGGAIKGRRLDLLFATHEQARQWGVKRLLVTVWGYADGKPAQNPRKLR